MAQTREKMELRLRLLKLKRQRALAEQNLTQTPEQRQALAQTQTQPPLPQRQIPAPSPFPEFAPEPTTANLGVQGAIRGVQDISESVQQLAMDRFGDQSQADEFTARAQAGRETFAASPAGQSFAGQSGRFLGNTAPALLIPGAQGSLGARAATGAAVGSGLGFSSFRPEATESERLEARKEQALTGAVVGGGLPLVTKAVGKITSPSARRVLKEAAPTSETLKKASTVIYEEIDNAGAILNPAVMKSITDNIKSRAAKIGVDRTITPDAAAAVARLKDFQGPISTTQLMTLREIFSNAAGALKPKDAKKATELLEMIDDSFDKLTSKSFFGPGVKNLGGKLREARALWHRSLKSEKLQGAIEKARGQASGFENGIRSQFRQILNNDKRIRGFTPEEIRLMKAVERGTKPANVARIIGKMGIMEGGAGRLVGTGTGAGLGFLAGSALGLPPVATAVAFPIIGQVSRKLAQKLTLRNAQFADDVVRAGRDGTKIVAAYMKNVPKAQRDSKELAELLVKQSIPTLTKMNPKIPIARDAVFIATLMQMQREAQKSGQ